MLLDDKDGNWVAIVGSEANAYAGDPVGVTPI